MTELKQLLHKNWWQPVVALLVGGGVLLALILFFPKETPAAPLQAVAVSTSTPSGPNAYENVRLLAQSAIVYDLTTGQVLYSRNSNEQRPLASLTKLLTIYAAVGALSPESPVTMTPTALSQVGDSADLGFSEGETFAFHDIARLALVASSNTAAAAITEAAQEKKALSGPMLLASAATAAGLTQTYAYNGTGLDESDTVSGGYGSAKDVVTLAGALLQKAPEIAEATARTSVSVTSDNGTRHILSNTDPDVKLFPHLLLSKTGFTDLAGGNLVVVYDTGLNHPVAIAVLGSTRDGRFIDVQTLMQATLAHFAGIRPPSTAASVSVSAASTASEVAPVKTL